MIHPSTKSRVDEQRCEGGCEKHRGVVRPYTITWDVCGGLVTDEFAYCDEAVSIDEGRGFTLKLVVSAAP